MRRLSWWSRLLLFVAVLAAGLGLGMLVGKSYRHLRREAAAATYRRSLQQGLEQEIRGIAVGRAFPDIPFQSVTSDSTVLIRDLLPTGGLLLYIESTCESCFGSIQSLGRALKQLGRGPDAAVLVVQGSAEPVLRYLINQELELQVVADSDGTLTKEYGVVIFPTIFRIGQDQELLEALASPEGPEDYVEVWNGKK